MAGLSDYLAQFELDFATGRQDMPVIGSRFLALFTTAPTSDAGTGGTEVTGGSYARVQIAGAVTAAGSITTAAATITMPNVSGFPWVVPGMNVYDLTNNKQIGTVSTWVATTLTLTGNATNNGSGATDSLQFSMFPASSASSGTEPVTTPATVANTNATITFAQSTLSWGTVTSWGIYDALTVGNLLWWDFLGNFAWLPFTGTLASPSVLTTKAHGYANADSVVVTAKFGGTLPATAGSWAGLLTVAGVTADTFTAGVNSTATGDGMVRKVLQQSIPANITASFSTSTMTLSQA